MFSNDIKAGAPNFSTGYDLRDYKWKTSEDVEEDRYRKFYVSDDRLILFPTAITMPEGTTFISLYSLLPKESDYFIIAPQVSYSFINKAELSIITPLPIPVTEKKEKQLITCISLKTQLYQKGNHSLAFMPNIFLVTDSSYKLTFTNIPLLSLFVYTYEYNHILLLNTGMIFIYIPESHKLFPQVSAGLQLRFYKNFSFVIDAETLGFAMAINYGFRMDFNKLFLELAFINTLVPKIFEEGSDIYTSPLISVTYRW